MASQGGGTNSRLGQMQMRFQQKQLLDREQRRIELTGAMSASAAVSDTNITAKVMANGKVRQMFDDRRRGAGIDRSNPLKPLAATLGTRGSSMSTTVLGVTTTTTASTPSTLRATPTGRKPAPSVPAFVRRPHNVRRTSTTTTTTMGKTAMTSSTNSNNNEEFCDIGESSAAMLHKDLSSMSLKQSRGVDDRNNNNSQHDVDGRVRSPNTIKLNPIVTKKSPGVVRPRPVLSSSSGSSARARPAPSQGRAAPVRPPAAKRTVQTPSKSTAARNMPVSNVNVPSRGEPLPAGMGKCRFCHRNFNEDRLAKHEQVCQKMQSTRRKIFDASKHRVKGTEAEKYIKKPPTRFNPTSAKSSSTSYTSAAQISGLSMGVKKNNWRQKHEEFIAAIRAAKQVKAHLARGGKLSDLPPPPPSENPDYIQCPHCLRRFNEAAAERHIPRCATMLHNKPKPGVAKKR